MPSVTNNNSILNTQEPSVSVIVAVYNQERFIGRCLRSLLDQTMPHKDYEIIVINDGSDDRTQYALELFCDPSDSIVKVITNKKNRGLPAAVNQGIKASRAPYVVRVDSDDFVNINFLNFLHFYLEVNKFADAIACDYYLLNDQEKVLGRGSSADDPIACGIMFYKEHLFDIGLYDESFQCNEEIEMRIRFEKKYNIHYLELPLYRYRKHDSNLTNNYKKMEYFNQKLNNKYSKNTKT